MGYCKTAVTQLLTHLCLATDLSLSFHNQSMSCFHFYNKKKADVPIDNISFIAVFVRYAVWWTFICLCILYILMPQSSMVAVGPILFTQYYLYSLHEIMCKMCKIVYIIFLNCSISKVRRYMNVALPAAPVREWIFCRFSSNTFCAWPMWLLVFFQISCSGYQTTPNGQSVLFRTLRH